MKFDFRLVFESISQFRQSCKHKTRQIVGGFSYSQEESPTKSCGDKPYLSVHPVFDKDASPNSSGRFFDSNDSV